MQKRNIKCTLSPSSLQRKRQNDFEIKQGSWTREETYLIEAVMSFLSSASIVLSDENVTKMYSFVALVPLHVQQIVSQKGR